MSFIAWVIFCLRAIEPDIEMISLFALRSLSLAVLCFMLAAAPALAGGSLTLTEMIEAVATSPKLVDEINNELKKNNVKAEAIVCTGGRFGNQWEYLGGARAAPYECDIGMRKLQVDADLTIFDRRGKSIGNLDKANPKRARTFKESNFKWAWSSN